MIKLKTQKNGVHHISYSVNAAVIVEMWLPAVYLIKYYIDL